MLSAKYKAAEDGNPSSVKKAHLSNFKGNNILGEFLPIDGATQPGR